MVFLRLPKYYLGVQTLPRSPWLTSTRPTLDLIALMPLEPPRGMPSRHVPRRRVKLCYTLSLVFRVAQSGPFAAFPDLVSYLLPDLVVQKFGIPVALHIHPLNLQCRLPCPNRNRLTVSDSRPTGSQWNPCPKVSLRLIFQATHSTPEDFLFLGENRSNLRQP